MWLELLPLALGLLALVSGALGLLLALTPLRRPRLVQWSLLYALTGALLVSAWGLLRGEEVRASPDEVLVTVTFSSDPMGAEVMLGTREAGRTPVSVELPRGVRVAYRVLPGDGVLLPGRFAAYAGSLTPQEDTRLSIWLDRLE